MVLVANTPFTHLQKVLLYALGVLLLLFLAPNYVLVGGMLHEPEFKDCSLLLTFRYV